MLLAVTPNWAGAAAEKRMALVIGNAAYRAHPLATPANDAELVREALRAAGFDVVGARDLDGDSMHRTVRDLLDKASKAGPDAVVAFYFAGYGIQVAGENYLLPVDVRISGDADISTQGVRVSEITRSLAALHPRANIVILDAARSIPLDVPGEPLASGLAWAGPEPDTLLAFNATPGTAAPDEQGIYGAYAKAVVEAMREGGVSAADMFKQVRLRVYQTTNGAQLPWDFSRVQVRVAFSDGNAGAPRAAASLDKAAALRTRPMPELSLADAYLVALFRDTFDGYADFLAAYGREATAKRIHAILAVRREAITWLRTYQEDTPESYWSYLSRYPRGPHAGDSRRSLRRLAAPTEPPANFARIEYDVPAPLPGESEYLEQPALGSDSAAPPPQIIEPPSAQLATLTSQRPATSDQVHALPPPTLLDPRSVVFGTVDKRAASPLSVPASTSSTADAKSGIAGLPPWTASGAMSLGTHQPPSTMDPVPTRTVTSPLPSNEEQAGPPPHQDSSPNAATSIPLPVPRPKIPSAASNIRPAPPVSPPASPDRATTPRPLQGLMQSFSPSTATQPPAAAPAKPR
jgi:uncharacterized caspase-like protein